MIQNGCTLFPHFFLRSWCKGRCKKSCTTWDVKNPINSGINHQPQLVQDFFHQQYHYPYVSDLHVISTSPVHPRRCHPRICQVDGHGLSFVQESHILVGRLEDSNHSGLGFSWLLGREVGWRTSPDTVLDSLKKVLMTSILFFGLTARDLVGAQTISCSKAKVANHPGKMDMNFIEYWRQAIPESFSY